MNHIEILNRCKAIEAYASELGFYLPSVDLQINWLEHCPLRLAVLLRTSPEYASGNSILEHFYDADDIESLFTRARAWLDEQENPTQIRIRTALHKLSDLADELEELEIASAPLREIFTAMTTNLLEHHNANQA